ncbi:MAG: alpha/beta hydrolase, partial [Bacteroidota bacterium]
MIFQIIGLIFLLFFLGGLVFVFSGPKLLPDNVQAIIDDAMQLPIPNLTPGKTGFALNGKRKFYYEARPAVGPQKGTVLLIMGHSSTMMLFPEHFINPICEAGYQVIRYDNRGTGQSDWVKDWNRKNAYDLEDMVGDGLAVLDANGVQQAHVVGVSMGGMIAQSMAIHYGDRVKTLTSIMSSGYMMDPEIKAVNPAYQKELVRRILRYMLIGGPK